MHSDLFVEDPKPKVITLDFLGKSPSASGFKRFVSIFLAEPLKYHRYKWEASELVSFWVSPQMFCEV